MKTASASRAKAMQSIGLAEIEDAIDAKTLQRARDLCARGQVIEIDVNGSGTVIVSRVKGRAERGPTST